VEIVSVQIKLVRGPADSQGGAQMKEILLKVVGNNKLEKVQPVKRERVKFSDDRERELLYYNLPPGEYIVQREIWHNDRKHRSHATLRIRLSITKTEIIYKQEDLRGSFPLDHL
jgi:hypothetical protein